MLKLKFCLVFLSLRIVAIEFDERLRVIVGEYFEGICLKSW